MYSLCGTNLVIFFYSAKRKSYFFTFLPLFYPPGTFDLLYREHFHMILGLVVEVTEEINAGERLQFADADDIRAEQIVALAVLAVVGVLVLVLDPETEGFIATAVLTEQGGEEIFGDDHLVLYIAAYLVVTVDGAAFADVERIAEVSAVPVSDLLLHRCPDTGIEGIALGLHVGEEEGLTIGLLRILAVGRGTDMSMIVAGAPERIVGLAIVVEVVLVVQEVIVGIAFLVAPHVTTAVTGMHLVARPPLRFLGAVPFRGEVDTVFVVGAMYQYDTLTTFQFGKFQP